MRPLMTFAATAGMLFLTSCELLPLMNEMHTPASTAGKPRVPIGPETSGPPTRAIRIALIEGSVGFRAAGTQTWSRAELNRPIAAGDALWADVAAHAELDLGSTTIRMDAMTALDLLTFDDRVVQARITHGAIAITVRRVDADQLVPLGYSTRLGHHRPHGSRGRSAGLECAARFQGTTGTANEHFRT
jgi:hypothetical protein